MIKAVIFDQDGLMFDTERISGIAWHQAEKEWGIHLEESFLKTIRGMNHQDARIRFEEVFGDSVDFMAFRGKKQEIFEALLERDGIPVKPEDCLVLEDSLNGVEAGLRGGFVTVMVPDLTQPEEELKKRVYRVCSSLLEVKEMLEAERAG